MKRRRFIKTGLVTIAAGAKSPLALGEIIAPFGDNITQIEMENFTREIDISMNRISHSGGNYLKNLVSQTPTETEQNFFRSSLRSLLLIGNFGDLSIKGQVHPWMQKRMLYSAPEVNFSVNTAFDILRNMSDESKEDTRIALMDDPDLGDQILETLDLEAESIGVSSARRRQMKVMGNRIIRRLRHSPEMLFDEYIRKTEKLITTNNSDEAMEHLDKAQIGDNKYSILRNESESSALRWRELDIPDGRIGYSPIITIQENKKELEKDIKIKTRKGLRLLGVGLVSTAVGWLFIAFSGGSDLLSGVGIPGLILGTTIGPILILIALIILLIQAIRSKKSGV
jgi:hypothetical protein